ncbi:MAG TPA: hypothetical protein VFC70_00360, partial [Oscillospiraceae bacterium]|nr:hypothetical protein [Oscillospiraceae bacterium]
INLISEEVVKQLELMKLEESVEYIKKTSVLVIGDINLHSGRDHETYDYHTLKDFENDKNIEKYQHIVITEIENHELCDIALGRDSNPTTFAIQQALLCGKTIYLLQEALKYRNYSKTANIALYTLLDGYVNKIEEFGMIISGDGMISDNEVISNDGVTLDKSTVVKDEKNLENECNYDYVKKVVTESIAINICKTDKKCIELPKGTIITPLAKDVFRTTGKELILN